MSWMSPYSTSPSLRQWRTDQSGRTTASRGAVIAGGAAEVADQMFETLPTKQDAKSSSSTVWPVEKDDGASGRSGTSSFRHNILYDKLKKYGIPDILLQWFGSYLSNRQQRVRANQWSYATGLMARPSVILGAD